VVNRARALPYCYTCGQPFDFKESTRKPSFTHYIFGNKFIDIERAAKAGCQVCNMLRVGIVAFHRALYRSDGCLEEFEDSDFTIRPLDWGAYTLELTIPREHGAAIFKLDVFKCRGMLKISNLNYSLTNLEQQCQNPPPAR
jgi:hypothetical protein